MDEQETTTQEMLLHLEATNMHTRLKGAEIQRRSFEHKRERKSRGQYRVRLFGTQFGNISEGHDSMGRSIQERKH